MRRASEEWAVVETESRDRAKYGETSISGEFANKGRGARVGKGRGPNEDPHPGLGVVQKVIPSGSVRRAKRGWERR